MAKAATFAEWAAGRGVRGGVQPTVPGVYLTAAFMHVGVVMVKKSGGKTFFGQCFMPPPREHWRSAVAERLVYLRKGLARRIASG